MPEWETRFPEIFCLREYSDSSLFSLRPTLGQIEGYPRDVVDQERQNQGTGLESGLCCWLHGQLANGRPSLDSSAAPSVK